MLALARPARLLPRLARDRRGATIVEFALILPLMCMIILVFLDFGYRMYMSAMLQGAMSDAVRVATIGDRTGAQIDQVVYDGMRELAAPSAISIVRKSYRQFSGVKKPEPLVEDKNGNGKYDTGDCWTDLNPNSIWDADAGASGVGGADDILYYEVTVRYKRVVPLGRFMGWQANDTVSGNTMIRNQPYAGRAAPVKRCS